MTDRTAMVLHSPDIDGLPKNRPSDRKAGQLILCLLVIIAVLVAAVSGLTAAVINQDASSVSGSSTAVPPSATATTTSVVRILHVNDHHSHVEEETLKLPLSASLNIGHTEVRVSYGGYPRLVAAFRELSAASNQPVIKLHAGDAITGTLWYTLFKGQVLLAHPAACSVSCSSP
jgi:5'-nucleotidase / UDP-sugar diphosphatase